MANAIKTYVRWIDAINRRVGKFVLYLVFVMIGILLFSSISRTFFNTPHLWTMETAQFTMAAYYMLGGGYSLLLRAHVRMDVFYERWSPKNQATVDAFTSVFLIFYLVILLYGAISSTSYAIEYGQRNYSSWGPPMAPIKVIMTIGIILMLLQAIATFFKDLAKIKGKEII
jgi:TRAP-type mannitol/chloroaromatic compound transport system permease small subunit